MQTHDFIQNPDCSAWPCRRCGALVPEVLRAERCPKSMRSYGRTLRGQELLLPPRPPALTYPVWREANAS